MIIIISPSKSQNLDKLNERYDFTQPIFKEEIDLLIKILKNYKIDEIGKLMKISYKLAEEVFYKNKMFNPKEYSIINSKAAIFTFIGDAYNGLYSANFNVKTINYAQDHLLILSGLYGLIRPLDLIQTYRLEMNTKIKVHEKVLYKYWQDRITSELNNLFTKQENKILINLASKEYSKAIDSKNLHAEWLDINFQEKNNETFKTIGIYAKKARGLIARYILENQIENIDDIKNFDVAGYKFNKFLSKENSICFTR